MRYAISLILALVIHVAIAAAWWWQATEQRAATGGGTGGSISVALLPRRAVEEPGIVSPSSASASSAGADRATGGSVGSGSGTNYGPGMGDASGTGGSNELLAEIRRRIEAAKHYPLLARRLGLAGTSELIFELNPSGALQSLRLLQSSGAALLDDEAVATIRRAAPFPYYPEPIQVGIRFDLN